MDGQFTPKINNWAYMHWPIISQVVGFSYSFWQWFDNKTMLKRSKLTVLKIPQIPDHFGVTVSSWHPCGLDTFFFYFWYGLGGYPGTNSQGPALLRGQNWQSRASNAMGSRGQNWQSRATTAMGPGGKGQHYCGVHGAALTVKAPLCHTRGCTGIEGLSLLPVLWGQSLKT